MNTIKIETRDISLAARILAVFPDFLDEDQKVTNDLSELGDLVEAPQANIIKLPNISASIPQMKACILELQAKGYRLPNYPEGPTNQYEHEIKGRSIEFLESLGASEGWPGVKVIALGDLWRIGEVPGDKHDKSSSVLR